VPEHFRLRALCACAWLTFAAGREAVAANPEAAQYLDQATQSFQQHDYEAARQAYEHVTQVDPHSLSGWSGLGWSLWELGDRDAAFKIWSDAAKTWPTDRKLQFALAQAHEARGDLEQAASLYAAVLQSSPNEMAARLGHARISLHLGQNDVAERDVNAVLQARPDDFNGRFLLAQVYRATGRVQPGTKILNELSAEEPDAEHLRTMADVLLQLNRPDEAISYYHKDLARAPDDRSAVRGLARAHAMLQQYTPAIDALQQYAARHPEDVRVRGELAHFADLAGDHNSAQQQLRQLIKEQPNDEKWSVALARSLEAAGQVDEPEQIARQVIGAHPDNIDALEILYGNAMYHGDRDTAVTWLEHLVQLDPSAKRLNKLGDLYGAIGDLHTMNDENRAARKAYESALKVYQRLHDSDPYGPDGLLGMASALRLLGRYDEAISTTEQVLHDHPNMERGRRELYEALLAKGDYERAQEMLQTSLQHNPNHLWLQHEIATVQFKQGDHKGAIAAVRTLLQDPTIRPGVPVLLYHGISEAVTRPDALSVRNFQDQMRTLKQAGYQSITMQQLLDFYERGAPLPPKAVLITFDDARNDSFRNADPVLRENGFTAVMFTPVAEVGDVGKHGPFNAIWTTVRQMRDSGRWEIQCHSYLGHEPIAIDEHGTQAAFLSNRMWLADQQRLETHEEFITRLQEDYERCASELSHQLPGIKLIGYAYPFGEVGQRSFANEPKAVDENEMFATRYFHLGFVQDPAVVVTRSSTRSVLPRFEVPSNYTGADLLDHLRDIDPYTSTQLLLADLYSWDDRYSDADEIFDQVARDENVDRADVLTRRGRVAMWQGDFAGARHYLAEAQQLQAQAPRSLVGPKRETEETMHQLDVRTSPETDAEGAYYADNHDRASYAAGPNGKLHLTDRFTLSASYRYRELTDDKYVPATVTPTAAAAPTTPPPTPAPVPLRAVGYEAEGGFAYAWNARAQLSAEGGVARFEDRSPTPQFPDPDPFKIGTAEVDVPLGDFADVSLRGQRNYVPVAAPTLSQLAYNTGEGRLKIRPWQGATLDGDYAGTRYSDGNTRRTLVASVLQEITEHPEFQIGYRFTADDTRQRNPLFYTPDHFMGHDAVLKLITKPGEHVKFELEGDVGAGHERGGPLRPEASASAALTFALGDHFNVSFGGARWQAATFHSEQATAELALLF
jgi:tetratricopeptide (TPR) repeat protein